MVDTLKAAGFDVARDVRSLLPAEGAHSEWFWRREFPAAYQWLFK
jgi:metallo-beta-lactamase class B